MFSGVHLDVANPSSDITTVSPDIVLLVGLSQTSIDLIAKKKYLENSKAIKLFDCPPGNEELEVFGSFNPTSPFEPIFKVFDDVFSKGGFR